MRVRYNKWVANKNKDGSDSIMGSYEEGFKSKSSLLHFETTSTKYGKERRGFIKLNNGNVDIIPLEHIRIVSLFDEFINLFKRNK